MFSIATILDLLFIWLYVCKGKGGGGKYITSPNNLICPHLMPGQTLSFSLHVQVRARDTFVSMVCGGGTHQGLWCFWGYVELDSRGHKWMDVITHLNSKGTTALLFIPGDLPSPLLYLPCRVSLCIDPNTGRKTIKWYPELARLQINCQLPVNAAGVAPSFSLTHSTAGSRSAVRLSAGSETALAMLLNWSVLLIQGTFLRMKP